jgi:hypothetical protein
MRGAHDDNVTWGNRFTVYERCARREQVKSTEVNARSSTHLYFTGPNMYKQVHTTSWTGPRERLKNREALGRASGKPIDRQNKITIVTFV